MTSAIAVGDRVQLAGLSPVLTVVAIAPGPPCFAQLEHRADGVWRVLGIVASALTKVPS